MLVGAVIRARLRALGIGAVTCAALVTIALFSGTAGAGDLTRFELDDGSVIVGEALGLAGGVYRIRTPALGEIDVEAARIRRMERATAAAGGGAGAGGGDYSDQLQGIQRSLVGDPDIMQSIIALQQDPQLQRVLQDPELIGLITSGNVQALREHEGFGGLMSNPGIRAIIDRLLGPDGGLR
ncbi:hypothetical protein [uncultured Thiohalocapsa sp.]|uniref:hypothetical protein n=1 Tax=uncultured Thiohalocapsa sp. TaxID=768990 RepID=UPI0025DC7521|nr:hypothetical protein [uncultured Thiohalocapsa sp.]